MNKFKAFKMDGLGNDFIIFDQRTNPIFLTKEQIIKISKRNNIGCDQVIFVEKDHDNDAFLKFYNSDGGEINACGNGSRCVAYFLMEKNNNKKVSLKTKAGILLAKKDHNNLVNINIGQPNFKWNKIPLSQQMDNKNLKIKINNKNNKTIEGGFALSVGNPQVVFFVNNINEYNLKVLGPKIENHNYFPEKCNVSFANIINKQHIKIKVWERGVGLTKSCGTAACAVVVSASILKLSERSANIEFDEGLLNIDWKSDNNIYMTGKVSKIKEIIIKI